MAVGERGGSTRTLEQGVARIEENKTALADAIRSDIRRHLSTNPSWHRNDLKVDVPADSKNAVGAVVSGLVNSGEIVETGERRKSSDPASHGRKSNVYRLAGADGSLPSIESNSGSCRVRGSETAVSSGPALNDESLARFRSAIRWRMTDDLVLTGEFRVESLDDMRIPDAYQFLIREAVGSAKRRGFMEGERGLYRVTVLGREVLTRLVKDTAVEDKPEPEAIPLPLDIPGPNHYDAERKAA